MAVLPDVRPSPIAGQWYPDDPAALRAQIEGFLAAARPPKVAGQVVAVIAPHAGYRYSGSTAGCAFRAVFGLTFERVVIVSPMHQPYPQAVLTSAHSAYATPLGVVEIDQQSRARLARELEQATGLPLTPVARDTEHSLEIELPFLQCALASPFQLIPVMLRDQSAATAQGLARALVETLRDAPALLVASTDLSHFYPARMAGHFDAETLRQIEAFSPEGLYRAAQTGAAQACGLSSVAAVLWAARALGADTVEILNYGTSAEASGDYSSVVGYGAAVVLKRT